MKHEAIFNMIGPWPLFGSVIVAGVIMAHPVPFGWASLVLMAAGALLLAVARWPLYRERRFLAVGNSHLHGWYRRVYYIAHILLWAGIILGLIVCLAFDAGRVPSP